MLFRLFALMLFVLPVSAAHAADAATLLHERLAKTASLSADFHQQVTDEDGETYQQSTGRLIVQRPFKLYWETIEPFRYLIVTDGVTLWRFDSDLDQLNTEAFDKSLAQAPILILTASAEEIAERFQVEYQSTGKAGDRFLLTPLHDAPFTRLQMSFDEDQLQAIEMHDSLGQVTLISLNDIEINREYSARQFVFDEDRDRAEP